MQLSGSSINNPGAPLDFQAQCFQARMELSSATQIVLLPYRGSRIWIAGEYLDLSIVSVVLDFADNLLASDGTDDGAGPAAQDAYYAYVSNASASYAPQSLRLSTFQPSELEGVLYLGTSGNAANWRYVGQVGTWGSSFKDDAQYRLVGNYYNRLPRSLFTCPGYVDDNANTTISINNAAYGPVNGGIGDYVAFIGTGGVFADFVQLHACFASGLIGANVLRVGISCSLLVGIPGDVRAVAAFPAATQNTEASVAVAYKCDTGINVATLVAYSQSVASTLVVDRTRNGSSYDPPSTYLSGLVLT